MRSTVLQRSPSIRFCGSSASLLPLQSVHLPGEDDHPKSSLGRLDPGHSVRNAGVFAPASPIFRSYQVLTARETRLQDLLVITAELPDSEPPSEAVLTKAASAAGLFESQLYLFETVGTLISILNQVPSEQVVLLNAVLDPLLSQLEQSVRPAASSPADYNAVFKAHHLIMAIGNVAKGFPDLSARQPTAQGEWVQCFRKATEAVLASAKIMTGFVVIRDAVRSFSFLSFAP